jgi:hypothetical protein
LQISKVKGRKSSTAPSSVTGSGVLGAGALKMMLTLLTVAPAAGATAVKTLGVSVAPLDDSPAPL